MKTNSMMTPGRIALSVFAISAVLAIALVQVQARKGFGDGGQEYGYVKVREGAYMFYWLYYYNGGDATGDKPLVLWLQGGPGASGSGYGNFVEIGPLNLDLEKRNSTWVNHVNLMFIDNPVGTGFSFVNGSGTLSTNNSQISADLIVLMKEFVTLYPQFETVPFYIFCESYGGKMTAEFALNLYKEKKAGNIKINLKGISLGDSWISPIDSVMTWGPYLLETGMVDYEGYAAIMEIANKTKEAVENEQWENATIFWDYAEDAVEEEAANVDFYNILTRISDNSSSSAVKSSRPGKRPAKSEFFRRLMLDGRYSPSVGDEDDDIINKLMNGPVKKALGITANVTFQDESDDVFDALMGDFMKPVVNIVEELLSDTDVDVNVQSGQLDLIVDTPGTLAWAERMTWYGAEKWVNSTSLRVPLTVDGYIEGYVKTYGNFSFYWVDRAGHMIPVNNPTAAVEILRRITKFDES